jgi:cytochrome oxidase Cu insertion factor (SCO1/SenC/PrrC family)
MRILRKSSCLGLMAAALLLALPMSTAAQNRAPIDVHSLGPQVGDRVPDFNLPDQHGQLQTLNSIKGPNGTMLLFHRSADW